MHFTSTNITKEQLEVMIGAIDLEYKYNNDYELAALLSRNFQVNLVSIIDTLKAYRSYKDEDWETISKKTIYHGRLQNTSIMR